MFSFFCKTPIRYFEYFFSWSLKMCEMESSQGQMSNEPLLELLGASFMSCGLMCEATRKPPQECLASIMLQVFRVIANAFDCDQV